MTLKSNIEELVNPIAASLGAYLIDIEIGRNQGRQIVEIFIDSDEGVTTRLCSEISRKLSRVLDTQDILRSSYYLVISSPGIDRPLKFPRQYPKNIGRTILVKCRNGQNIEKYLGILKSADEDEIAIKLENGSECKIKHNEIVEAHINAEW